MSIARFLAHLRDPAPGFDCYFAGDDSEGIGWMARVSNSPNAPANPSSMEALREMLGRASGPFEDLYQVHDGIRLYDEAVELYPIGRWRSRSKSVLNDLLYIGWEEAEVAEMRRSLMVFGEIGASGNHFAVRTVDPEAGSIHYLQHDPIIDGPLATDLADFLDGLVTDPAAFLDRMGCYTRFSDGETDRQWIPKTYRPNAGG